MELLTSLFWENALGVVSWAIRIAAFIIVPFRRSPAEARTWLLAFFVAPVPAWLLYLAIGRPEHSKKRKALFAQLPDVLERAVTRSGLSTAGFDTNVFPRQKSIAQLATNLASLPPLPANDIELLPDYDGVIDRLVEDIDAARHHVHLEFYIFANDATAERIMVALERAEGRGVKTRVLIDAMGSFGFSRKTERNLRAAGVEVQRVLPLARRWNASRIDLRNHRKIVIIDGMIGYTGSQNAVDAAVSENFVHQELMCRVRGPIVGALQIVFLGDWYLETETELDDSALFDNDRAAGQSVLQTLPTGPDYEQGRVDMIFTEMFYAARDEIVIATPYFVPNEPLLQALKTAATREVKVTLILSRRLDSKIVSYAQRSYYTELLKAGVNIVLFGPDFLHAKHMRIDDCCALIGSSNMDVRSFELNAEISIIIYDQAPIAELRKIETMFIEKSERLDFETWKARSLLAKTTENSMRLLSDLL